MMAPRDVYALRAVREKLLDKHDVEFEEAVEALLSDSNPERVQSDSAHERRYLARGRTDSGRLLNVVFVRETGGGARVITAYEPTGRRQRRRHRRR